MPRALYWFRWGAAYTWITGLLLMGLVIYMGGVIVPTESSLGAGAASAIALAIILLGFVVYELVWNAMAKNEQAGVAGSFVLGSLVWCAVSSVLSARAPYI